MPETLDFAVVGGGLAGLATGALLARKGHKVGVFEKHGKLGGYAQYFGKEPTFDSATHLIGGCGPGGWTRTVLEEIGALERVELLPLDPVYQAIFPEHRYCASPDVERFRQELSSLWPSEADGIRRFLEMTDAIGREYLTLADGLPKSGVLVDHHIKSLSQYLDGFTRNPELRAALSVLWLYGGLPPERLSAVHYAMLWHTYHTQGSATVRGGVRALSQAIADTITERGGTVETGVQVEKIARVRGRVTGVRLSDGRELQTRAVISTASPHDTFEELLAAEGQADAGYPQLRHGFVVSTSALQVHLLVNGPLEAEACSTILHTTYDLQDANFDLQREEPEYQALVCTILDREDPSRVPDGKHMLSLFTLAPYSRYDNWNVPFDQRRTKAYRSLTEYNELKEQLGDAMVERAENVFPGLAGKVEARKVGTPISMERYTFNTGAAAFGWANGIEQSGANRPGPRTPFRSLYMAGHWTFPGGSIAAVMQSARLAAEAVLADG